MVSVDECMRRYNVATRKEAVCAFITDNIDFLFGKGGLIRSFLGRGTKTKKLDRCRPGSKVCLVGAGSQCSKMESLLKRKGCNVTVTSGKDWIELNSNLDKPSRAGKINHYDYYVVSDFDKEFLYDFLTCANLSKIPADSIVIDPSFCVEQLFVDGGNVVRILVISTGGLGDYIVQKKFIQTLVELDDNICVFVENDGVEFKNTFDNAVYSLMERVVISPYVYKSYEYDQFDLVMTLDHTAHIIHRQLSSIKRKSEKLVNVISTYDETYDYLKDRVLRISFESVIRAGRASIKGINRYDAMTEYTDWVFPDHKVSIPLRDDFNRCYSQLQLGDNYVTINRGADSRADGKTQMKVWPQENYVQLISILKSAFPDLKVVQLGNPGIEKMSNADDWVFGEHIEVVKYVLKNSRLHIDSEGGLVHLATQLDTKCVVLFGPTPISYYGYPENINIGPSECGNCMGLTEEWYTNCLLGEQYPPRCMKSITPQLVFDKILNELRCQDQQDAILQ